VQHPSRPQSRHTRSRLRRALAGVAAAPAVFLALVSSVVLHGATLLAVAVLAVLAAAVAAGSLEEHRVARAWITAGATVAVVMVVTGIGVLAGARVAVLACGLGVVAAGAAWLWRGLRGRTAGADDRAAALSAGRQDPAAPVSGLSTAALAREWRRTTTALVSGLDQAARQRVVRRRGDVLDELERREPRAFDRWLAAAAEDGDPGEFFGGRWNSDTDAA
jgi:hypothetical protein